MLILNGTLLTAKSDKYIKSDTGEIVPYVSLEVLDPAPSGQSGSAVRRFSADISAFDVWHAAQGKNISIFLKYEKEFNKQSFKLSLLDKKAHPTLIKSAVAAA